MKVYTKNVKVKKTDLDELNHVNNVQYIHWMQDVSREHWRLLASKEIQSNYIWVVINHNIDYKNAAKLNDSLTVRTFVAKTTGCFSIRVVEITNEKSGLLYMRSETKFCLLDAKNTKPMRVPKEIEALFS